MRVLVSTCKHATIGNVHSLPIFLRLSDHPVILLGDGEAAEAKRRLLSRAGALIVGEETQAAIAIVAVEDEQQARAAVARLRARGVLVNATDRPALCDFTLPAIIDRDPVLIAIGSGGASAGLGAALRQRLEVLLPQTLGPLARALHAARERLRVQWPDAAARRRALTAALGQGAPLDPLVANASAVAGWLEQPLGGKAQLVTIRVRSPDPEELTLREARLLGQADRLYASAGVPGVILDRARADAARIFGPPPDVEPDGLWIALEIA
jgi:uroporphyrin-III C-methyltransferase/precorrin-2 dehydrogenase/sirohydrochlorin ferrochelatase